MESLESQKEEIRGAAKKTAAKSTWRELAESILIALVLAFVIRFFLFQPFYIPSASMEPTLRPLDRIIVSKINYWFHPPAHSDIIVFKFPVDPSRDFVKRVIGVGGDTVEVRNNQLIRNGEVVAEPYLAPLQMKNFGPVKVPEGQYFVMGDNRNFSDDSRYWGFVPDENVIGKAVLLYWPIDRIQVVKGV
ncbi:signal peptidase I [Heliophilum fasciatum]|uniref:Signal peptidase I n=1 Tax=Heliophilum fasciatum TaxID=35700 RepID=A0A4R2RIN8_9FIRM|nr:signal peptidase I [Heliophilum fasciatum]MCW2278439.1 signal peptidase I [Heliophilum fasciatum]TCP63662.1 signal peptidase I [Heliophilum fasciatum]